MHKWLCCTRDPGVWRLIPTEPVICKKSLWQVLYQYCLWPSSSYWYQVNDARWTQYLYLEFTSDNDVQRICYLICESMINVTITSALCWLVLNKLRTAILHYHYYTDNLRTAILHYHCYTDKLRTAILHYHCYIYKLRTEILHYHCYKTN